jgi:kynureninase
MQGCINLLGNRHTLELVPSHDNDLTMDTAALEAAVDDTTALVLLSHVVFKSGFMYDGRGVTELAHKVSTTFCIIPNSLKNHETSLRSC